jgi:hypothetical protein
MAFTVYKTAKGYRWLAISSTAYRDRDGEIVSTKALQNAVERTARRGDFGPLRFWHEPGLDIGTTDYQAVSNDGKYLVESGLLDATVAPDIIHATKARDYQMSIGFNHAPTEPDKDGVFHRISIFERSIVPGGRAANTMTAFSIAKE